MPREYLPEIDFEGLYNLLKTKELGAFFSQRSFFIRLHPSEGNGLFYTPHFFQKKTGESEAPRFALQKSRYFGHVDDLPGLWLLTKNNTPNIVEEPGEPDFFFDGIEQYVLVPVAAFTCPFIWWACPVKDENQAANIYEKCIFPLNEWAGFAVVNYLIKRFTPTVLKTSGWSEAELSEVFAKALFDWFLPQKCTLYNEENQVVCEEIYYGMASNHTAELSLSLCNGHKVHFTAGAYQLPSGFGPIHEVDSFRIRLLMLKEQLEGVFTLLHEICFPVQSVGTTGNVLLQEAIRKIDRQKESLENMAAELSGLRKDWKAVVSNKGTSLEDYAFYKKGDKWKIIYEGNEVNFKGNPYKGLTAIWMILEANGEKVPGDDLRIRPNTIIADLKSKSEQNQLEFSDKAKARKSSWDKAALTEEIKRLLKSAEKLKDPEEALEVYEHIKELGQILRQLNGMNWRNFKKTCVDEIEKINSVLELLGKKPDRNYVDESGKKIKRKRKNEGTTRPIRLYEDVNKNIDYALRALGDDEKSKRFKDYLKPPRFIHSDVGPFRFDPYIPPKINWQFYSTDEIT